MFYNYYKGSFYVLVIHYLNFTDAGLTCRIRKTKLQKEIDYLLHLVFLWSIVWYKISWDAEVNGKKGATI